LLDAANNSDLEGLEKSGTNGVGFERKVVNPSKSGRKELEKVGKYWI